MYYSQTIPFPHVIQMARSIQIRNQFEEFTVCEPEICKYLEVESRYLIDNDYNDNKV